MKRSSAKAVEPQPLSVVMETTYWLELTEAECYALMEGRISDALRITLRQLIEWTLQSPHIDHSEAGRDKLQSLLPDVEPMAQGTLGGSETTT